MTSRAPIALAVAMAITPTGPQPVTSTFRPETLGTDTVWTALPKFSWSDAIERGMSGGSGQALMAGTATYSA